jgi:ABC-type amino acid transport system permease subunit
MSNLAAICTIAFYGLLYWEQHLSAATGANKFVLMMECMLVMETVVLCYWSTRNAPVAIVLPAKHSFGFLFGSFVSVWPQSQERLLP